MFLRYHGRDYFEEHIEKKRQLEKKWKFWQAPRIDASGSTNLHSPKYISDGYGKQIQRILGTNAISYEEFQNCEFVEQFVDQQVRSSCCEFPSPYQIEEITDDLYEDLLIILEGFDYDFPEFEQPLFARTSGPTLCDMLPLLSAALISVIELTVDTTRIEVCPVSLKTDQDALFDLSELDPQMDWAFVNTLALFEGPVFLCNPFPVGVQTVVTSECVVHQPTDNCDEDLHFQTIHPSEASLFEFHYGLPTFGTFNECYIEGCFFCSTLILEPALWTYEEPQLAPSSDANSWIELAVSQEPQRKVNINPIADETLYGIRFDSTQSTARKILNFEMCFVDSHSLVTPFPEPEVFSTIYHEKPVLPFVLSITKMRNLLHDVSEIRLPVMWNPERLYRCRQKLWTTPAIVSTHLGNDNGLELVLIDMGVAGTLEDRFGEHKIVWKDNGLLEIIRVASDECFTEECNKLKLSVEECMTSLAQSDEDNGTGLVLKFFAKVDSMISIEEFCRKMPAESGTKRKSSCITDTDTFTRDSVPEAEDSNVIIPELQITAKKRTIQDAVEDYMLIRGKQCLQQDPSCDYYSAWRTPQIIIPPHTQVFEFQTDLVQMMAFKNSMLILTPDVDDLGILALYSFDHLQMSSTSRILYVYVSKANRQFRFFRKYFERLEIGVEEKTELSAANNSRIVFASVTVVETWLESACHSFSCVILDPSLGNNSESHTILMRCAKTAFETRPKNMVLLVTSHYPTQDNTEFVNLLKGYQMEQILTRVTEDPDVSMYLRGNKEHFVDLSGHFLYLLQGISDLAAPYLSELVEGNLLADSKFEDLTLEYLKLLIKQTAESVKIDPNMRSQGVTYLKALIAVCTLKETARCLCEEGISTSLKFFRTKSQEPKYTKILKALEGHMLQLFEHSQAEIDAGLYTCHPKIDAIKSLLLSHTKETPVMRILIICASEHPLDELPHALKDIGDISAVRLPMPISALEEIAQKSKIIIMLSQENMDAFQYDKFTLIIEYQPEHTKLDFSLPSLFFKCRFVKIVTRYPWKSTTNRTTHSWIKSLRHCYLRSWNPDIAYKRPIDARSIINGNSSSFVLGGQSVDVEPENINLNVDIPCTSVFIGERLLQNQKLLRKLQETTIKPIERTLKYDEDIILDDRNCIMVYNVLELTTKPVVDNTVDAILDHTMKLSLRYSTIWIILENYSDRYLSPPTQLCLQHLFAGVASSRQNIITKFSFSVDDTVTIVRKIIHEIGSSTQSLEDWCNRSWMVEEEQHHEAFLSQFPCLNNFSAQMMLCCTSFQDVCRMTREQLVANFPWIHEKQLEWFHQLMNIKSSGARNMARNAQEKDVPALAKKTFKKF